MSRFGRALRSIFGSGTKPQAAPPRNTTRKSRIRGSYDIAQAADGDENHWIWADSLNANAANSPGVRKTLRERAQYEADNNGYCGGLCDRLANDLIGTGPRPQLRIPGAPREAVRAIELAWLAWSRRTNFAQKCRLLDLSATIRGEGFAILSTNPRLPADSVQLDLKLYETDQVETPFFIYDPMAFSGGRLDEFGNVTEWHFLKAHPGSDVWLSGQYDYDAIPAERVVHWFKPRRPGQIRGVPEILSSLTLYAYLRRYTLATVQAAETAASIAGVIETDNVQPDSSEDPGSNGYTTFDKIPMPRGTLLTMPANAKAKGFDATQPTTNYPQFKGEILTEAGSAVGAPRNVSTNSSAEYNYSSGRLDRGIYEGGIKIRRADFRNQVLDPCFRAWLNEAALVKGLIPDGLPLRSEWSWEWFFDGFPSVDPEKDAKLNDVAIRNGTKTYAQVYAEAGMDWEEAFEQQAREQERRVELGLPLLDAAAPTPGAPTNADAVDQEAEQAAAV